MKAPQPSLFRAADLPRLGVVADRARKHHSLIDVTAIVKRETTKAVLIDHGGAEPCWLPRSLIEIDPNGDGRTVTVTLTEHLATEKGIL